MINVSYNVLLKLISVTSLYIIILYFLTIKNILSNNYSGEVKDILNKIAKKYNLNNICDDPEFKKLCNLQNNLDKVDKDRNKLKKDLIDILIQSLSYSFISLFFFNNNQLNISKKNSYNYNKIISLIISISGIYHLYYSYSKTKNTRNELNLTKEILEESKNKPIPTGEAHDVVKKLNDDLNTTLEKYNKELSSFLNYNYLLLSIWTVIVILLILITIKIFFNHQK
tara:strand:- start:112 stop:789 length:678 start_codon:yes stop_codon:yes gene_type:complete